MKNNEINSIGDLRSEIIRLKAEVDEREIIIQRDFNEIADYVRAPLRFLKQAGNWFTGRGEDEAISKDWMTSILQLGFPYLMNKTFFRKSSLIMKAMITLISQKAVQGINLHTITSWVQQLSTWIKKQKEQKKEDYGVPPDSEAF